MTTGLIAATTYAAGEQINLFAGVRLTRIALAAQVGDTKLVVERSLGMDATGIVVVDGVTYAYSSLTDGAIGGLTVTTPQGVFSGVQAPHALNAVVTDATRNYSGLDVVRRSFFVDTAEGADLSVLGRILGVPRSPAIPDDDTYRKIIKAIAYSPRTTRYALTSALDAIVGPGQYVLAENPAQPGTVTVYIDGADLLSDVPQGKTYLGGERPGVAAGNTLTVPGPALAVLAVHLAPSSFWAQLGEAVPSTVTVSDPGSLASAPFVYVGDESTVTPYTLGPGCHAQQLTGPGYYRHHAGLLADSTFDAGLLCVVPQASALSTTDARRFGLLVVVNNQGFAVGMVQAAPGMVGLGLADFTAGGTGALYAGVAAQVPEGKLFEVHISRGENNLIAFQLNGKRVQTLNAGTVGAFDVPAIPVGMAFGAFTGTAGKGAVRAAGLSAESLTDLGSLYDTVTPAASDTLTFTQPLVAADVGRVIRVLSGGGTTAAQGQARGLYVIDALVSSSQAKLVSPGLGTVSVSGEVLTCAAVVPPLTYPDDLGRQVVLSGSLAGNNGTYTIAALMAEDGVTPLSRPQGQPPVGVRTAQLTQATPMYEAALQAELLPNFGTGQATVVLSGGLGLGDLSGANLSITPRTALPFDDVPYSVAADDILSAQVFDEVGQINHVVDVGPPATFVIWPFYLNDPTNVVNSYLSDMVAAGVTLNVVAGTENAK